MAFNPFGIGFMIPSAEEIAVAIVDEERLRRSEEELRKSEEELRKSGKIMKTKVAKDIREQNFISLKCPESINPERPPIYPHITAQQEAEMLERGELLLDIMHRIEDSEIIKLHTHWADKNREEAQHPWYVARQKEWDERVAQGDVRVNANL